jgi:hypothetical protein
MMSAENLDNEEIIYTSNPVVIKGVSHRDLLISAIFMFIGLFVFLLVLAFAMFLGPVFIIIGLLIFLGGIGWVFIRRRSRGIKGVQYVLTNKRAMVILADRHDKKILQECNLADTVPIVQKKRSINLSQMNRQTGNVTATTGMTVGDVVFMQKATPKVIFRDVEDPDGILRTVEQIKKSMLT